MPSVLALPDCGLKMIRTEYSMAPRLGGGPGIASAFGKLDSHFRLEKCVEEAFRYSP
jgi:hypothetical protein